MEPYIGYTYYDYTDISSIFTIIFKVVKPENKSKITNTFVIFIMMYSNI